MFNESILFQTNKRQLKEVATVHILKKNKIFDKSEFHLQKMISFFSEIGTPIRIYQAEVRMDSQNMIWSQVGTSFLEANSIVYII